MSSKSVRQISRTREHEEKSKPSAIEFEIAYQARVAIDRIKFAIKHSEQFSPQSDPGREIGLHLLDALGRLEAADRRFQQRSGSLERSNVIEVPAFDSAAYANGKGQHDGTANGD